MHSGGSAEPEMQKVEIAQEWPSIRVWEDKGKVCGGGRGE